MSEFRRRLMMQSKTDNSMLKEYFTIEALEDGLTIKLSRNASQYRIDNGEWTDLAANTETPSVNSGQKIQFKITNPTISSSDGIGAFTINKKCNIEGNIMSLLYGDNFEGQINLSGKNNAFYKLFYNCTTLQSAENLILPATTLASNCYREMFEGCTSLIITPLILPATTLESYCYYGMFNNCNGLTEAPQLLATTLATQCCANMFGNCTSLTVAPELPATTLALGCYMNMFNNCTSLTTAPELPATTLIDVCYANMFRNCSNLNYIKMLAINISASSCLGNWLSGVAPNGTFIKSKDATWNVVGVNGIPEGWTVITE